MECLKEFETTSQYNAYTADTSNFILPNVSICDDNPSKVYYNPYVDPCASEKVKTTYEWVEIGGVKWATKNVGALTVTDYGQYFAWAEVQGFTADQVTGDCHSKTFDWVDYKYCSGAGTSSSAMTKYNATDGLTTLEADDDAATVNMGSGWRMPTFAEFKALTGATTSAWTTDYQGSGVNGLVCTDKTDSSKVLFFPASGRGGNTIIFAGTVGNYWSKQVTTDTENAVALSFYSSSIVCDSNFLRYTGLSVRGVAD